MYFLANGKHLSMLKGKPLLAFKWQLLRKSNQTLYKFIYYLVNEFGLSNICKFKIMLNGSPVAKCKKQTVISGNNNSYEKKHS